MTNKTFNLISKITESNLEYSKWGVTLSVNTRDHFGSIESINLPENKQYLYIYFEGSEIDWDVEFFGTPDWMVTLDPEEYEDGKVGIYEI